MTARRDCPWKRLWLLKVIGEVEMEKDQDALTGQTDLKGTDYVLIAGLGVAAFLRKPLRFAKQRYSRR